MAMDFSSLEGFNPTPVNLTRADLLSLDLDARLASLWADLEEVGLDRRHLSIVATYMRAAYGKGYCDALKEPRGQLLRDHGYLVPQREGQDGADSCPR